MMAETYLESNGSMIRIPNLESLRHLGGKWPYNLISTSPTALADLPTMEAQLYGIDLDRHVGGV